MYQCRLVLVLHLLHLFVGAAGLDVRPVWIDCDLAVSESLTGTRDIDDALALVQVLNSRLTVVGVSTVFGNALVPDATAATRRLLARFFPLYTSGVFPGAASPLTATPTEAGDPNEAVTAMAAVLRRYAAGSDGRVDLLALGPITNIAALIRLHPQLVDRAVGRIVFVGGRRPKQAFRIGTNITLTLADMNFEKDAPALSVVLQHVARRGCPVALVLAPFEIATHIRLKGKDLDWLAARREQLGRGAAGWLAKMARPWLRFWDETFDVDYFHPFDTLAVLFLTHPHLLECDTAHLTVEEGASDTVIMTPANRREGAGSSVHGAGVPSKMYLHARLSRRNSDPPRDSLDEHVWYCHSVTDVQLATGTILDSIAYDPAWRTAVGGPAASGHTGGPIAGPAAGTVEAGVRAHAFVVDEL